MFNAVMTAAVWLPPGQPSLKYHKQILANCISGWIIFTLIVFKLMVCYLLDFAKKAHFCFGNSLIKSNYKGLFLIQFHNMSDPEKSKYASIQQVTLITYTLTVNLRK